jgi:hypothetical protein
VFCILYSFASAQWQPDQRLTNDPAESYLPNPNQHAIAAAGDTIHVVFVDNRSGEFLVYYTRSLDAGANWDSAIPLSPDSDRVFYPSLAVHGATVHVAWPAGASDAMMYRRSTNAGATWPAAETLITSTGGLGDPCLAADGDNVGITWGDGRDGNWNGELYYKQSSDGGSNWTDDTRLTVDTDSVADGGACLAVSGNHRYIVWTRGTGTPVSRRRGSRARPTAGRTGSHERV